MSQSDVAVVESAEPAHHSHHASGKKWFVPAVTALGIVYGDIGTSPLYAFQVALGATGHTDPTPGDVIGIVSLIFWAILAVVAFKYVSVVMRADNEGEGGILALLSLSLSERQISRTGRFPVLLILGIIGAAFIYGDGIITPAISVMSAMEGLNVAAPALTDWVLPLTLAVLVALFSVQFRGTGEIGKLFGPIMISWFLIIAVLGLIQILHNPAILVAADPRHAIGFLIHGGKMTLAIVGAAFLALTGAEALYADMGHVGATPIRRAWFGLVLPALTLSYFGQGALILSHPEKAANPFFELAPGWAALPLVILAAMASIIASQALISGAFSLTRQAMQLHLMPRMQIRSTSGRHQGQIYMSAINWTLMVGAILVVIGFRTSSHLAAAYGIAVSGTMLVTQHSAVQRGPQEMALALAARSCVNCGIRDDSTLSSSTANATKFVDGGWFPLVVGTILAFLMLTWRSGAIEVQRPAGRNDDPVRKIPG